MVKNYESSERKQFRTTTEHLEFISVMSLCLMTHFDLSLFAYVEIMVQFASGNLDTASEAPVSLSFFLISIRWVTSDQNIVGWSSTWELPFFFFFFFQTEIHGRSRKWHALEMQMFSVLHTTLIRIVFVRLSGSNVIHYAVKYVSILHVENFLFLSPIFPPNYLPWAWHII